MHSRSIIICSLFGIALSSLFSDILKSLAGSGSSSINNFLNGLPADVLAELESNEQQAGQFVCGILDGDTPGIIDNIGEDIWTEISDDWSAVTSFIEAIPSLAPQVLEDIVQDGEDVVSVIGEIITDPAAALTVIESGVEVVVSDITSIGGDVISFFQCLFGNCPSSTSIDPAATLSSSCDAIRAAATTTYSPAAAASSTYQAAQTSAYQSQAAPTTTQAAASSTTTVLDIYANTDCSLVSYYVDFCASSFDSGFATLSYLTQASCLCYSSVDSTSLAWRPDIFDGSVQNCANYLSGVAPDIVSDFTVYEDLCTDAGDVRESTTAAMTSTSAEDVGESTTAAAATTKTSQQPQSTLPSPTSQGGSGSEAVRPKVSQACIGLLGLLPVAVILL